jgi:hypothetical protein
VVKFKQEFIDAEPLNKDTINYINRYMEMFPTD